MMKTITKRERQALLNHLHKAQDICARYGMALGNGGEIATMLSGIASEIENGDAQQNEFLID